MTSDGLWHLHAQAIVINHSATSHGFQNVQVCKCHGPQEAISGSTYLYVLWFPYEYHQPVY